MNTNINWFPGHMVKSLRELADNLKIIDCVLVVLDARIPFSSMNSEVMNLASKKPIVIVFNKSDLVEDKMLDKWLFFYQNKGFLTLKVNATNGKNINKIYEYAKKACSNKLLRNHKYGIKSQLIKSVVVGIPNSGKSTLINRLTKSSATRVANTPGVTRSKQWIRINENFELLDTPGVLWPKFDEDIGMNLAITGAIKDTILPIERVVEHLITILVTKYPDVLVSKFGCLEKEFSKIIDFIGIKRNCLIASGIIDTKRVYQLLLKEVRSGKLGKMIFDDYV